MTSFLRRVILLPQRFSAMTKSKKTVDSKANQPSTSAESESAISLNKQGLITLKIHAKPGAKHSVITGEQEIGVAIAAPPREGQANEELVESMAKFLGLKKSEVGFERGAKSRSKVLVIDTNKLSIEEVKERLTKAMGN